MATGEGKTLTIGLAAALAAWRGGPVHVITANDYLVKRDAEWLREFYELCGLRVGFVTGLMSAAERARRLRRGCDLHHEQGGGGGLPARPAAPGRASSSRSGG